jgi:hypothetical protein
MFTSMATQLLLGHEKDKSGSGSLTRIYEAFYEEWLAGKTESILPKLLIIKAAWLARNLDPNKKTKVSSVGGWDDIVDYNTNRPSNHQGSSNEHRNPLREARVKEASSRDTHHSGKPRREGRPRPYCDHCRREGHLTDKCWIKDPSKRPKSWGKLSPNGYNRGPETPHADALKTKSFNTTSKDEIADQYKVDNCSIPGIVPEVIIWDSGSQVNWLSKQAVTNWKPLEEKCRNTSIRIYTVDEVHTGSKPIGLITLPIKWAEATINLTFVVMNDPSKKVIFGSSVLKNHTKAICLEIMSMKTWSGHTVPFSKMDYDKHSIPRVCSVSIGAEVKWKVSTNSVVTPDYPTPITLEPEAEALDSVPARVLYDRTFIKPLSDKGVIIDVNSFSVKQGSISVLATSASPFAKPLPEGMSLLASTIKPGNLSA